MKQKITFGAGCFWHIEDHFMKLKGVINTKVGFMGGTIKNPSYKDISTGKTDYAEVCQIIYDSKKISCDNLLKEFWKIHDPTQLNKQGPDIGTQYRSIIFYHDNEQKKKAIKSNKKEQKKYKKEIATEIVYAKKFYKAEESHQKYLKKCIILKETFKYK